MRAPILTLLALAAIATSSIAGKPLPRGDDRFQLGMTRPEVEAMMGTGVLVDYKRIKLRNPHRYETMRVSDKKTVEILYYVTEGYVWNAPERSTLTPLIFENGRLAGWGWPFIQNDKSKYVSGPADVPEGK